MQKSARYRGSERLKRRALIVSERELRKGSKVNDRIIGATPIAVGMIHHQVNEDRHEAAENGSAITDLVAIDPAIPGSAAVYQLVAKDVEPIKHRCQNARRITAAQCRRGSPLAFRQPFLPVSIAWLTVEVTPERRKDILVVEKQADLLGEARPDSVINPMPGVQLNQGVEIGLEGTPFTRTISLDMCRVCGIEAYPQQDEPNIGVVSFGFGTAPPTDCTMHTQRQRCGKVIAQRTLLGFETVKAQRSGKRNHDLRQSSGRVLANEAVTPRRCQPLINAT